MENAKSNETQPKWIKLLTEYGPLVVFVVTYWGWDKNLILTTKAVLIATVIATAVAWFLTRRLPWITMVTAAIVLVFGGLTIYLNNDAFFKMKPAAVSLFFSAVLLGGIAFGWSPIRFLVGEALSLTDEGWRRLTVRFALFFVFLAVVNEIIWRFISEEAWAIFKFPGYPALMFVFFIAQAGFIARHSVDDEEDAAGDGTDGEDMDGDDK